MVKFSIVTITFNAQAHLRQTLESVRAQEFTDYEHLVWDGGSSDGTLDIIKSFPHIKLYEGKDSGIADAMNRGAAFASGEFLLHLHADDYLLHPKVLGMVATTLKQHPMVKWLYGQAWIVDGKGEKVRKTPFEPFSAKRLRKYNFITHPATFVKRELFEEVGGFAPSLKYCMDYDLWLRLAQLSTPFVLPTPLACFREHEDSLSTSEPVNVANEAYRVRNRYVKSFVERIRSYRTWKRRIS